MTWRKFATRKLNLFKIDLYIKSLKKSLKDQYGFEMRHCLLVGDHLEVAIYYDAQEYKQMCALLLQHFERCYQKHLDPYQALLQTQVELISTSKKVGNMKYTNTAKLLQGLSDFTRVWEQYQPVVWFVVFSEDHFLPYAHEKFLQYTTDPRAWEIITTPNEPSLIQKEYVDLLELACDFSEQKLIQHHNKYSWLKCSFVEEEPYDVEYYRKRLREIISPKKDLEKIREENEQKAKKFQTLMGSLSFTDKDKALFLFVNKIAYMRQTKDEGRRQAYYYLKPLFEEMKRRMKVDYDILFSYLVDDVLQHLQDNSPLNASPPQRYVYLIKDNIFSLYTSNLQEILQKEGVAEDDTVSVSQTKGRVAHSGKVTGTARVISFKNQLEGLNNVQKGDILIAVSTKPEFVPAMEKAAAFVTDEGGITSHAAIVAREMGKPCIVGTGNATKIFKNGDTVEVNGETGIVTKLPALK